MLEEFTYMKCLFSDRNNNLPKHEGGMPAANKRGGPGKASQRRGFLRESSKDRLESVRLEYEVESKAR